jgi:hypothetical protein
LRDFISADADLFSESVLDQSQGVKLQACGSFGHNGILFMRHQSDNNLCSLKENDSMNSYSE